MRRLFILLFLAVGVALFFLAVVPSNTEVSRLALVPEAADARSVDTKPIQILFTGDVMLDRGVAAHAIQKGDDSIILGVQELFSSVDAVVINIEGTITTNPSVAMPNHDDLRFTFDPRFAAWLKDIGVTVVSLSNNHTDDFGMAGLEETKILLRSVGIAYFGSPFNDSDLSTKITVQNKTLCFVGYEGFISTDPAPIAAEIARLRPECAFLAATMHAGEEYQPTYTTLQQTAAHAFIDAGADVVIGTHPHVVEPLEIYKDKAIFYSLGNFIFDQDFSFATEHGIAVRATWEDEKTQYVLIPITIQGSEVKVTHDEETAKRTLTSLINEQVPPDIATAILSTHSFMLP
ncbi:MAG: CapA family protein [Minisyncoccia bacterium]